MIAFNRDDKPEDDLTDKLSQLISKIYEEGLLNDIISEGIGGDLYHTSVSLVEINDIIYKALYKENSRIS